MDVINEKTEPGKSKKAKKPVASDPLLVEVAWEVCNQLGGIYTVIRSKAPCMVEKWGSRYCLLGPYVQKNVLGEFEPVDYLDDDPFGQAVSKMRSKGFEVHYGRWLVSGRPKVILFNPYQVFHKLGEIKYLLWKNHYLDTPGDDDLLNQVIAFGYLVKLFFTELDEEAVINRRKIVGHFHEWMAGTAIPDIRRENINIYSVFTTHATLLGRYLAMNNPWFYDHLPFLNWEREARNFNITSTVKLERAAAHGANVLTRLWVIIQGK